MIRRILLIMASLAIKLFVHLPLILIGLVIVPIALLFRTPDDHLPKWAWLWDNANHGTDGDSFWIKLCGDTFWCRFQWLGLRNPTSNFGMFILGFVATGAQTYIGTAQVNGSNVVGNLAGKQGGWYWVRDGWAWEFYYIQPYTDIDLSGWQKVRKCIRFRAGWKLQGRQAGERCAYVFAPNPVMSYSGK